MSMKSWAEREIKIACKHENPDRKEGEWDYGCACYESALKAFNSLCEDGHSGFSISMTKHILNRLIDGKPLTPIEDTEDIWSYAFDREDGTKVYQCKRMRVFFKHVHLDGTISYSDNDRFYGVNLDSPDITYHNGLIDMVMSEIYPITMPYIPFDKGIKVVCDEFLTDPKNGDYDTIGILYYIAPEGERRDINRFFKEGTTIHGCLDEIGREEYEERKEMDRKRKNGVRRVECEEEA